MFQISKELAYKNALQYYPQIAEEIDSINTDNLNVQISKAKKVDEKVLSVKQDGRLVYLYSKFNPIEEVERWVSTIDEQPTHVILFGLGLGYHAEALCERFPSVKLHIIEPNLDVAITYFSLLEEQTYLENIENLLVGFDENKITLFFNSVLNKVNKDWKFLNIPKYQRLYKNEFQYLLELFKKTVTDYQLALNAHAVYGEKWQMNVLENLPIIQETENIMKYKNEFSDKSVILVASGPSLKDYTSFLKHIKEKSNALIIAAGTSINFLTKQGIEPDFIISYDPNEGNYKNLQPSLTLDVPLIFGTTIHPKIPAEYKGPKVHMTISQDQMSLYLKKNKPREIINDGPTITAVCLDLLYKLDVRAVYLVGQDLCFIGEQYQATDVYPSNEDGKLLEEHKIRVEQVENNAGQMVETNKKLNMMKQFIEELVKQYTSFDIFNLSFYGAKIAGIPYKNEKDVEKELIKLTDDQTSITFLAKQLNKKRDAEDLRTLEKAFSFVEGQLKKINHQLGKYQTVDSIKKSSNSFVKIQQMLHILFKDRSYHHLIYPVLFNEIQHFTRVQANTDLSKSENIEYYLEKALVPLLNSVKQLVTTYQYTLDKLRGLNDSPEIYIDSSHKKFLANYLDDKSKSVIVDFTPNNDTLVIAFGGLGGALGMPVSKFLIESGTMGKKIIFIRDMSRKWYVNGLSSINQVSCIDDLKDYIEELMIRSKAKKVELLGISMGGYIALLMGKLIQKVDVVNAFVPQTFLDDKNRKIFNDNRWNSDIAKLNFSYNQNSSYLDLKILFNIDKKTINDFKVNIYYANDNPIDKIHAERLKDFENVNLIEFETGGHELSNRLCESGMIKQYLNACR
ncbi:6-hydroxymethylpterin diphosphokinase MptE-like protein [Amphibacillus sp. Q70]|uniref:6-hydroxymethylpterin diphosphokinase MptE-like protein n=1 Tax=Amphibacillus sp. Q70 TaxID=3453416 RepID=UPI003F83DE1D